MIKYETKIIESKFVRCGDGVAQRITGRVKAITKPPEVKRVKNQPPHWWNRRQLK